MKRLLPVFLLSFYALLFAEESWETAIAGVLTTPPAEGLDGRIYCTAEDRALHALDGITGREFWRFRPGRKLIGFTIVSPDGTIFILTNRYELVAVSPGGWERWRFRLDGPFSVRPAVDHHGIFYGITEQNTLISFDRMGNKSILHELPAAYSGIYIYDNSLLLEKENGFDIYSLNGENRGFVPIKPKRIVILENGFWCKASDGNWYEIGIGTLTLEKGGSPLPDNLIYPQEEVLITDDARFVSGRNDWFMEAYKQGVESYDSRYQPGGNSSRTNSLRSSLSVRTDWYSVSYVTLEYKYLDDQIKEYENISTFQDLLHKHPDYDLQLSELLSDSDNGFSSRQNPSGLDSHSVYRIYRVLTKWGDLRLRDSIIRLCRTERSSIHQQQLFDGLANIGIDSDGRSLSAIYQSIRENDYDEALYRSALQAGLTIAQYNGGKSMKEFLGILRYVGERTGSGMTSDMIKTIMKDLSR